MSYKYKKEYPWEVEDINFKFEQGWRTNNFEGIDLKFVNRETNQEAEVNVDADMAVEILNRSSIFDDCANRLNDAMRKQGNTHGGQLSPQLNKQLDLESTKSGQQELVGSWLINDKTAIKNESEIKVKCESSHWVGESGWFVQEDCYLDENEFSEYFENEVNANENSDLAKLVENKATDKEIERE